MHLFVNNIPSVEIKMEVEKRIQNFWVEDSRGTLAEIPSYPDLITIIRSFLCPKHHFRIPAPPYGRACYHFEEKHCLSHCFFGFVTILRAFLDFYVI